MKNLFCLLMMKKMLIQFSQAQIHQLKLQMKITMRKKKLKRRAKLIKKSPMFEIFFSKLKKIKYNAKNIMQK